MKLTVLVDNNTIIDSYFIGEPGLSFYIEDDNKKILFDTGYSNIFLNNAKRMNIDLSNLDYLVLSHGHNDHTGGLRFIKNDLSNTKLIAHPDVFVDRVDNNLHVGSPVDYRELNVLELINGKNFVRITNNLFFLGEIERTTSFENKTVGYLSNGEPDKVLDDSALVYKTNDGLFIITGCSHSGICNIIEQSKKIFNDNRIIGIIGGFHLMKDDYQLTETVNYLKENNIKELYPCHCCNINSKIKMASVSNIHDVGVGLTLEL